MEDSEIRQLLARLARPHASGGQVVERAAILAEGADFPAILDWIVAHAGQPEAALAAPGSHGLHSMQTHTDADPGRRTPQRYVLPPDALG
ncbi:MAG TPA: hypothetical protein VG325_09765 [Solirubrobacteraceae bacterium]|nr:hypothetical protein [Solirubrobacteraceae bacterium]